MHVLVCDDDDSVRDFLTTCFESDGWEVESADSGEACLARLAERVPDALVIDQVMPGLTGTEVAEQLRSEGFAPPIILCSAYLGGEHQETVRRLDLIGVNKVDVGAVMRIARAAVLEQQAPRRAYRQVWPD